MPEIVHLSLDLSGCLFPVPKDNDTQPCGRPVFAKKLCRAHQQFFWMAERLPELWATQAQADETLRAIAAQFVAALDHDAAADPETIYNLFKRFGLVVKPSYER